MSVVNSERRISCVECGTYGRLRSSKVVFLVAIESTYGNPIGDQQQHLPYLAPYLRYGELLVENRNFFLSFKPSVGVTPGNAYRIPMLVFRRAKVKSSWSIACVVLIWSWGVRDRQTHGQTEDAFAISKTCITSYANAL